MKSFAALLLAVALTPGAAAFDSSHPGFVDLDEFDSLGDAQAVVDVRLDGWLLGMAKQAAAESDDPDAQWLSGIESVRVRVFELDDVPDNLEQRAAGWIEALRDRGWEDFTTVRSETGFVYLLVTGSEQELDGILLVALDEGDDAVFVNVAGRLRPQDVARLIDDKALIHTDIDLTWSD